MQIDSNAIRLPTTMNSALLTWLEKGKDAKKKKKKKPEQDSRTLHLLGVVIFFIKYLGGGEHLGLM